MRFLSLFSGIEAASEAWAPLGWECAGVSEVEAFACAALKHRHPTVPNLGDVTKITEAQIADLGQIDVLVFGSPCQDLSVAGKRKGLDGARSGLFFAAMRIVEWARLWNGLRFAVWENVPGAFSSNKGADFASVVGALAGLDDLEAPKGGWGSEGCAVGEHGMCEWAVLDAQWFGLAQRRKRVFAVTDFGDWTNRPPILLERHSLRGDTAPSREAWQVAPTIPARSLDGGGLGTDFDCDGGLVAHTLRGEGFDASEGGTGRGTPLVLCIPFDTTQITSRANRSNPQVGDPCHPLAAGMHPPAVAFGGNRTSGPIDVSTALNACSSSSGRLDFESETFILFQGQGTNLSVGGDVAGTLRTGADRASGNAPCIAFDSRQDCVSRTEVFGALGSSSPQAQAVAFAQNQLGEVRTGDVFNTLNTNSNASGRNAPPLAQAAQVRRLTPTECERLQGFPDGHTAIPWRKKSPEDCPDGPRYKALGNSMAVPVMAWIGTQIEFASLF